MSNKASYILVDQATRFIWLGTYLSKFHDEQIFIVFSTSQQSQFFKSIFNNINNMHLQKINFVCFDEMGEDTLNQAKKILLMDVPNCFQQFQKIIDKKHQQAELILILYNIHKNYIKIIAKKLSIEWKMYTFNKNKLLQLQDKLIKIVEANYELNRAAFYAYGSFLKYINSNKLKNTFRTDRLDVNAIGRTFGFTTPPRVNLQAKFLTKKAQLKQKRQQKKKRQQKRKQKKRVERIQQNVIENKVQQQIKIKKTKKIKKIKKVVK